jgi:hypothetical protein
MRRLFIASALLTLLGATPGMAEEFPWCVLNPGNVSPECRYVSYEQCRATSAGIGACSRNPGFTESQTPSSPAPAAQNTAPPPTGRKRAN